MSILNENIELDNVVILKNIQSLQPNDYDRPHIGWKDNPNGRYKPLSDNAILDNNILRCDGEVLYWGAGDKPLPWAMDYIQGIEGEDIIIGGVGRKYPHFLRGQHIKVATCTLDDVEQLDAEGEYVCISTHGVINKCNIKATTLCIGFGVCHPYNSNITCTHLKFHSNGIFDILDRDIQTQVLIYGYRLFSKYYKTWRDIRAIINNPKKFQGILPRNPKIWFRIQSFDELTNVLGVSDILGLEQITFQDHTVSIHFSKLLGGNYDVKFIKDGKIIQ